MPMKMEQTVCSETSAYKLQEPGNHLKESIQHSVHGESLKTGLLFFSVFSKTLKIPEVDNFLASLFTSCKNLMDSDL